jgi:hypothetical protein
MCFFAFAISSSTAWASYDGPTTPEVPSRVGITWTLVAIAVGLLLYSLRYWRPFYYGLLEVIGALLLIYFNISPAEQPLRTVCYNNVLWAQGCAFQSWLIFLAGIYIFVRGVETMGGDHLLNWVTNRLRRYWHSRSVIARRVLNSFRRKRQAR